MVLTEESSVEGLAGVAPDRKISRLRRLGRRVRNVCIGTGMVFCICLCLLVGVASPSDALVGSLLKIGETIAAPAEVVAEEVAGAAGPAACATGVGTAICIGAVVGTAAYMTRDTWWPVVKGFFGSAFSRSSKSGTSGCTGAVSPDGSDTTGVYLMLAVSYTGCSSVAPKSVKAVGAIKWECRTGAGQVTTSGMTAPSTGSALATIPAGASSGSAEVTTTLFGCGNGQALVYASVETACIVTSGSCVAGSGGFSWGAEVPDDEVSTTATVGCTLPDGSKQTLHLATTGDPSGVDIPSCRGAFPGSVPNSLDITSGYPGAEQPVDHLTFNDPHTDYPDCFDANGAFLNSCVVRVYVDGQPCHVGVAMCSSWQTADTDYDVDVSCHWGPYVVALSSCDPLADQYRSSTGTKTITQAGTDTGTKLSTGTSPSTGSDPGSSTTPTEGTNPDQDAGTDADGNLDKKSCMSQGWSWNPVSWVKVPVECAIEWAFVPDSPLPEIAAPGLAAWLVPLGTLDSDCGGWLTTIPLGVGSYSGEFPISLPTTCDGIGGVTSDITRGICPALFGFIAAVRVYRRAIRSVG